MMSRKEDIENRLAQALKPAHCEVIDESPGHTRGEETHFKIVVVSEAFSGKSRVARQRLVYNEIKDLFDQGLHALTQLTFTPEEWQELDKATLNESPACAGRGKN